MTESPLRPEAPLVAAVRAIEASHRRIAVVIDPDGVLLGTLTDGDVRRSLLAGGTLETPLSRAMNRQPIVAEEGASHAHLLSLMRRGNIMAVPLVDGNRRFRRLVHLSDLKTAVPTGGEGTGFEFAVIMAGGEGLRLRPVTQTLPKAMVDIGGVPLLERQLEGLTQAGFRTVYISVNYLSHVIEDHFGDGRRFGIRIMYLREQEKLGTAGALTLLPETPQGPIVVMNGDILTTFDLGNLHRYHVQHEAHVTVAAVDYRISVPYGVICTDGAYVTQLQEKPSQRFLCNAGVYAVSSVALSLLAQSQYCNMTDLISACIQRNRRVAAFPVHEYWSDIGTPDDLEKARAFFAKPS
jgi:dTDP-glucose pyrophosphorylase